MDQPDGVSDSAGRRDRQVSVADLVERHTLRYWELFYALVTAAAVVAVVLQNDAEAGAKLGASALLLAMNGWYWAFGHRALRKAVTTVPLHIGLVSAGGSFVLFTGASLLVGSAAWVTPAIVSQTFWLLPLRFAAPAVVLICFTPATRELVAGTGFPAVLRQMGPAAVIFGMMSVLLGFVLTKLSALNERQAHLIESLEASRAEAAKLFHEAGMAAERERLSREIHDTLAQGFASIVTLAQAAESEVDSNPEAARQRLALVAQSARENLDEARFIVAALSPSGLHTGSLAEAVRRETDRFAERTGLVCTCEIDGEADTALRTLSTAAEVVLLRATQEALTNTRKHAAATTVHVHLAVVEDAVHLTVSDDGVGFRPEQQGDGFGLHGMRARVEQVGGALRIRSEPGVGTIVELEVPA